MKAALARWSEPLLEWLPDPRGVPLRRQITIAIVVSLLLHVPLVLLVEWIFRAPAPPKIQFARAKPKLKPIEIELVPTPKDEPKLFTLAELNKPEYLDSSGLASAAKPSDIPLFESDQDMIAASQNPATGNVPLPSMDGRRDRGFTNFKTQVALLGPPAEPFHRDIALASAPAAPAPIYKPEPAPPAPEKPQPAPPDGLKKVAEANENEIALPPEKPPEPKPIMPPSKPTPSAEMAKLIPPAPKQPAAPKTGYQQNLERTKIEGSISNRGAASVDAIRTPLGVYKKKISEAIGSRWTYYVKQRNDLITVGRASLTFYVTKDGHIQDVRLIDNTSNETFAIICQQSIREAELPPPPPEAFEAMKGGRMENNFSFTLYPN